jgi:hypothetical protein
MVDQVILKHRNLEVYTVGRSVGKESLADEERSNEEKKGFEG